MAFRELKERLYAKASPVITQRYKDLEAHEKLIDGTIYDCLPYAFNEEEAGGQYIPLCDRRPSTKTMLGRLLVDQVNALSWTDEQMPTIRVKDAKGDRSKPAEKSIARLIEDCGLDAVMFEAFDTGSCGSVAIIVRATEDGEPDFEVVSGKNITPIYDRRVRGHMSRMDQQWHIPGAQIKDEYKDLDPKIDPTKTYWLRVEFDAQEERRYLPLSTDQLEHLGEKYQGKNVAWHIDGPPIPHKFGCVNVIWIRNLVGKRTTKIDGPSTVQNISDNQVELDAARSQLGRGYRVMADPTLCIEQAGTGELRSSTQRIRLNPTGPDEDGGGDTLVDGQGRRVKSPTSVMRLGPGETVKVLEINGAALEKMEHYAENLRESILEVLGGMKASADNENGAQSGRAIEKLMQSLFLHLKRQRMAYGKLGLIPLILLLLEGVKRGALRLSGVRSIPAGCSTSLIWPTPITPTGSEMSSFASAVETLVGGSAKVPVPVIPRDLGTEFVATNLGYDATEVIEQMHAQNKAIPPPTHEPAANPTPKKKEDE